MKKSILLILTFSILIISTVKAAEIHYLLNFSIEPEQSIRIPVSDLVSFYVKDIRYLLKVEKILDESNFNVGVFPRKENVSATFFTLRPEITLNLDADDDNKDDLKIFFLGTNINKGYVVIGFKIIEDNITNLEEVQESQNLTENINTTQNNTELSNNEITGKVHKSLTPNKLTGILIIGILIILGIILGFIFRKKK